MEKLSRRTDLFVGPPTDSPALSPTRTVGGFVNRSSDVKWRTSRSKARIGQLRRDTNTGYCPCRLRQET